MGFIGSAIKGVGGALGLGGGGGSGQSGYSSKNTAQYEDAAKNAAYNMAGATKKADGTYDFSNVGKPITGAAGVQSANQGFDYSGINKALEGYNKGPQAMTQNYQSGYDAQAYKPTQFNYQGLPQQYYDQAYQSGSKDINRQGAGQLQQLQSAVGTRRPGLLLKAGQQNQRDVGENLANLSSQLGQQRMQQGVDLGVQQQQNQEAANQYGANLGEQQSQFGANEGYKGYQSRADLEKGNAQNAQNYLQGSLGAGQAKLAGQQSAVSNAQQDQMNRMNYLMNLYTTAQNGNQQSAQAQNEKQKNTDSFLGGLGGLAKGAASVGGLFCLPKGTEIETDSGDVRVEDILPGDIVKGGKVIATFRKLRAPGHKFYLHKFKQGEVIMSDGHPYFDELISKEAINGFSECTYDILTDGGHYFVNGIKLGSTLG